MIIGNAVITGKTNGKKPILALAEGTIVMINEGGTPTKYCIAQHNYQPDLNGRGRTLLVRKDVHSLGAWNDAGTNAYADSSVDVLLNSTIKALYDEDVQTAMGETVFFYTPGNGDDNIASLSRSIFLLSSNEIGMIATNSNHEGTPLPSDVRTMLRTAYLDSTAVTWWLRSPRKTVTDSVFSINESLRVQYTATTESYGIRPCFTLSGLATVAPKANEDGSYTLDLTA